MKLSSAFCLCCYHRIHQVVSSAILNQEVPANQIRHTRAVLDAIMSDDGATWGTFGSSEEIAQLFGRAVSQCEAHKAGDDVVQTNQF